MFLSAFCPTKCVKKAAENYPHALQFFPACCKAKNCVIKLLILILLQHNLFMNASRLKKTCDKAVNLFFVFDSIPHLYNTQEMCTEFFLKILFNSILSW